MSPRIPAAILLVAQFLLFDWPPNYPAQLQAIVLDGTLDASGYTLLAQDPPDDLAEPFASNAATAWMDLTALYVATDTTNLYVFAALPDYSNFTSTGGIGLAIDSTGDIPASGGGADPNNNAITYAFTSTLNNISATARSTANTILPDVVIRGNVVSSQPIDGDPNDGNTDLRKWTGSEWSGADGNWGGISGSLIGDHIAYASGSGVELSIPFTDLAVPPTSTLNLQFYVTRRNVVEGFYGAIDTIPSDAQSTTQYSATVQHRLATWPPPAAPPPPPPSPPPPSPCDAAAVGDGSVITDTLHHLDTDPAYRNPTGPLTATQSVTLTLRTCANDLASAAALVWNPADPLGSPAHTYTLTSTAAQPPYVNWQVVLPPPQPAVDRLYQFRLTDAATQSYFHPAQNETGPGAWSPTSKPIAGA